MYICEYVCIHVCMSNVYNMSCATVLELSQSHVNDNWDGTCSHDFIM